MKLAVILLLRCLGSEPEVCHEAAAAVWADPELAPLARDILIDASRPDLIPEGIL